MQAGKNVAATTKETVVNIGASAKSGLDKTKATVQEKIEKMTAHSPAEKERACERKELKISEAEMNKRAAMEYNAAAKEAARAASAGGVAPNHPPHQMSAFPGDGTGIPHGEATQFPGDGTGIPHGGPTQFPGDGTGIPHGEPTQFTGDGTGIPHGQPTQGVVETPNVGNPLSGTTPSAGGYN